MIERVLIAVDDSVESLAAARLAARLAAGWNASVRILNAIAEAPIDAEEAPQAQRTEATRLLAHVTREVRAAGIPLEKVDAVLRPGEPFARVLEEARTWHADLIVMGVSHHAGLRSPYVGSQTEHVLEFAECPVLVVPGPQSV